MKILRRVIQNGLVAFRKYPTSNGLAVLSVGLCIGLGGALVRLLSGTILLSPGGVADAPSLHRLYLWRRAHLEAASFYEDFTREDLERLRTTVGREASIEGFVFRPKVVINDGRDTVSVTHLSPGFLRVVGSSVLIGDVPAPNSSVAMVSYEFWRRGFGGDRSLLEKSIVIDSTRFVLGGVVGAGFTGLEPEPTDVWLPLDSPADTRSREDPRTIANVRLVARITPGSEAKIEARLSEAYRALHAGDRWPDPEARVVAGPLAQSRGPMRLGEQNNHGLDVIIRLGAVACAALVIAFCNLASTLLARIMHRRREVAIRHALGASRAELVAAVLAESLILGIVSGVVAAWVGRFSFDLIRRVVFPTANRIGGSFAIVDSMWTMSSSILITVVAGGIAAAFVAASPLLGALRDGNETSSPHGVLARRRLLLLQTSLCTIVLAGSAVFLLSAERAFATDVGYDADRLLAVIISTRSTDRRISAAIEKTTGIVSVSRISGDISSGSALSVVLERGDTIRQMVAPECLIVDSAFFSTAGIRLVRGRFFLPSDVAGGTLVAIVTESMAQRFWPTTDGLGRQLCPVGQQCRTIVGVVRDVQRSIGVARSAYYFPLGQHESRTRPPEILLVRTRQRDDASAAQRIRQTLQVVASLPANAVHPVRLQDRIERQVRPLAITAALFGVLAAVSVVAAGLGLFGLVSFNVLRRTREIAIRRALGSTDAGVLNLIVLGELKPVCAGFVLGALASIVGWHLFTVLIFEPSTRDMIALPLAASVLVVTALLASIGPALRAKAGNISRALQSN